MQRSLVIPKNQIKSLFLSNVTQSCRQEWILQQPMARSQFEIQKRQLSGGKGADDTSYNGSYNKINNINAHCHNINSRKVNMESIEAMRYDRVTFQSPTHRQMRFYGTKVRRKFEGHLSLQYVSIQK